MTIDQLPHRFRESSFRLYEPYIAQIVDVFPNGSCFDIKITGLSSVTFSNRLRDAMTSLHTYHWTTSMVDVDKFFVIHKHIVVRERQNSMIYAGTRETSLPAEETNLPLTPLAMSAPQHDAILTLSCQEEKKLVCLLASLRLLVTPLRVRGFTLEDVETLQQEYDVSLEQHGGVTTVI